MEYNVLMGKTDNNYDNLAAEAFFAIVNSEVFVWDAFEEALQASGSPVGVGRFIPLHFLARSPMRLQDLARLAHAKESAMSRLVERMVKDGLVSKERDGDDRRAVLLQITDEGRRVEEAGRLAFQQCLCELFGGLGEGELSTLCSLLARLQPSRTGDAA